MIARVGAVLVTGGLGGAMEAACRGAKKASGLTLGILPGVDRREGNQFLDIAVPTGMGEMRNALVVRAADGVLAVDGGFGTLSELALALKLGKPVVSIGSWDLSMAGRPARVPTASSAEDAVDTLMKLVLKERTV